MGKLPFFRHPYSGGVGKDIGVVEDEGFCRGMVEDPLLGAVKIEFEGGGNRKSMGKSTATSTANWSIPKSSI